MCLSSYQCPISFARIAVIRWLEHPPDMVLLCLYLYTFRLSFRWAQSVEVTPVDSDMIVDRRIELGYVFTFPLFWPAGYRYFIYIVFGSISSEQTLYYKSIKNLLGYLIDILSQVDQWSCILDLPSNGGRFSLAFLIVAMSARNAKASPPTMTNDLLTPFA